ncbi:MAG: AAA family ATPase [Chloroflexi bacterium]|nr:AAA family ATPase [Chloroflexota bacterium]
MDIKQFELSADQLWQHTDPALFPASTEELEPLDRVIGQERAVRSIDFGVAIESYGYNIFAVGPPGSGRTTAARNFLTKRAETLPVPPEWCYVYNFEDPRRPNALRLPPGRAFDLRDAMDELVDQLRREIPRAFESEHYEERRREIIMEMQRRQQALYEELERYLRERGFALIRTQMGLNIAPLIDGAPITGEEYQKLPQEVKERFESYRPQLQEAFDRTMRQARELDREARQAIEALNNDVAGFVVDNALTDLQEQYAECPEVLEYLKAVRQDVVDNVENFVQPQEEQAPMPLPFLRRAVGEGWFTRYKVNVLADARDREHAPVVIEDNPTYHNLIGRIEHRAEFGAMVTDFTQIRSGALHRANGGYLVMEAKNLLVNPLAWSALKRALHNREIKIEEMTQFWGLLATVSLEPEPIPLDVKVVLIGDELLYQLLYFYDEDFRELFKVKAEFTTHVKRDDQMAHDYAQFVGDLCRREKLRHFGPDAMARLYEEASRMSGDQQKVSTRFAPIADLVREASYWASHEGHTLVTADDVCRAVEERIYRLSLIHERFVENIIDGVHFIDTEGAVVGQVNGLSVMQSAEYMFGMPSRITARTFLGKAGVISIDREVKMSGPIHDKGQLILASYLSSRFAQKRSLSMSATITFEQLYSGVEGDSASSTELYALLSALSGYPIKQNLAVTGSVNQFGEVQPIGGVNAKIEGFFSVCKERGLTGDQGVLIPKANVRHLMLRDEVRQAVEKGQFHIYAVSTIEEGIELLTGVPAGTPDEEGNYPEGTVYHAVQAKLDEYAERMKEEGKEEKEEEAPAFGTQQEEEEEEPKDEGPDDGDE